MQTRILTTLCLLLFSYVTNAQTVSTSKTLVNRSWIDTFGHPTSSNQFQAAMKDGNGNIYIASSSYRQGFGDVLLTGMYTLTGSKIWEKEYSFNAGQAAVVTDFAIDGDYYYATGFSVDSPNARSHIFLIKGAFDNGDTVWARSIPSTTYAGAATVKGLGGSVLVAGTTQTTLGSEMTIIKFASDGSVDWTSTYDSAGFYDIAVTFDDADKSLGLVGVSGNGFGSWDFVTMEIDESDGTITNVTRSPNGSGSFSKPAGILKDYNNNIYIVGTSAIDAINTDIKIVKYDSLLNQIWVRKWGDKDSLKDEAAAFAQDKYDNFLITGHTTRANGAKSLVVAKYNTSGTLLWNRIVTAPDITRNCVGRDIMADDSLNVYVTGSVNNGIDNDIITICYDKDGKVKWQKTYASQDSINDEGYDVLVDSLYNVLVSGRSLHPSNPRYTMMQYEQKTFINTMLCDTDTIGLRARRQLIVQFDTSVLLYNAVNDKELRYGKPNVFLKPAFIDSIKAKIPSIQFDRAYLTKLAPHTLSSDTSMITNLGDTVKRIPTWAWFKLMYYLGDSSEHYYADTLQKVSNKIIWASINPAFHLFSCSGVPSCTTVAANDNYYCTNQYALHADDGDPMYDAGHINVEEAWAYTFGRHSVRIGVFDSHIEYQHPDFSMNGPSKVRGGEDFTTYPTSLLNTWDRFPDNVGHGTKIAGAIGALRGNEIGIAGVAGGNYCEDLPGPFDELDYGDAGCAIYSYSVVSGDQYLKIIYGTDVVEALDVMLQPKPIIYEAHQGTDINNFSIAVYDDPAFFPALKNMFYQAFRTGRIMSVTRADNKGNGPVGDIRVFPACFNDDWVLSTGGSEYGGNRVSNSYWGSDMDFIAPYTSDMIKTLEAGNPAGGYTTSNGTSYSCAYTTGTGALLLSYMNNPNGRPDPSNLAPEDVEEIIQRTADFPTDITTYEPPYSDLCGWGKINAGHALQLVDKENTRLLHFNSKEFLFTDYSVTEQSPTDITLKVLEPIPGHTNIIPGTPYTVEVWKLEAVVPHDITLAPNEEIIGFWARSSSSNSFPLYTELNGEFILDPYEKAYVDEENIPATATDATIWGYFYKFKGPDISDTWIPEAPLPVNVKQRMAYTVLIKNTTPVSVNEPVTDISISLFPNPTSQTTHLSVKAGSVEQFSIKLYNSLGQYIRTIFYGQAKDISEDISINSLSNGVYSVQIESKTVRKNVKLVVQK